MNFVKKKSFEITEQETKRKKKMEDALTSFTQRPERVFRKDRAGEGWGDQGKGSSLSAGWRKRGKKGPLVGRNTPML